jgi:hypothetical protein
MIAEANQVVAAIRFTNHIENLITESAALRLSSGRSLAN